VQHTTSWHLEVLLYEDGDRTRQAVLRTSAGTELRNEGIARRNPKDTDVPEIGETGHPSGSEWARARSVRGERCRYRAEYTPLGAPRVVRPCRFTISGKERSSTLCEQTGAESERSCEKTRSGVSTWSVTGGETEISR
jgi:Rv2632c-like